MPAVSKLHTPAATHTHTRIRKAAARVLKSLEARARVAVQPPLHALCTHRASPCGHRLERVSQSRACRNNALIAHVSTRSFTSQPLAPDAHTHTHLVSFATAAEIIAGFPMPRATTPGKRSSVSCEDSGCMRRRAAAARQARVRCATRTARPDSRGHVAARRAYSHAERPTNRSGRHDLVNVAQVVQDVFWLARVRHLGAARQQPATGGGSGGAAWRGSALAARVQRQRAGATPDAGLGLPRRDGRAVPRLPAPAFPEPRRAAGRRLPHAAPRGRGMAQRSRRARCGVSAAYNSRASAAGRCTRAQHLQAPTGRSARLIVLLSSWNIFGRR